MCRLYFIVLFLPLCLHASLVQYEGKGSLNSNEGTRVLHLKGTPYERGYQHGALLKKLIADNIGEFIDAPGHQGNPRVIAFKEKIPSILSFIPDHILEELHGLAAGSDQPFEKLLLLNLFPEMFHCSGITVQGPATASGKLYHVRALDYRIGKNLQHTAVLMLVEPSEGTTYMNVSYAGFIGCVTGMNAHKIALGEIGGLGYGHWDGMPMAFLMKEVLEQASSLEEAIHLFSSTPRTCEYYYLISDGNQEKAVGLYATGHQIHMIEHGTSYALVASRSLPKHYQDDGMNEKIFLSSCSCLTSEYQTALYDKSKVLISLFHRQPEWCIVLTGFTQPSRYPHIIAQLAQDYGNINLISLQALLNDKTTLSSNLHNTIFLPSELKMWVAHAGGEGECAYTQKYTCFDLPALLQKISFD